MLLYERVFISNPGGGGGRTSGLGLLLSNDDPLLPLHWVDHEKEEEEERQTATASLLHTYVQPTGISLIKEP